MTAPPNICAARIQDESDDPWICVSNHLGAIRGAWAGAAIFEVKMTGFSRFESRVGHPAETR
jgi:hypothetical protein